MSRDFDVNLRRELEGWLAEAPSTAPPRTRAAIVARVRDTPQRPGWLVRERGLPKERPRRGGIAMLAVGLALVALLGTLTFAGVGSVGPAPRPSPLIRVYPIGAGAPLGVAVLGGAVWLGMFDVPAVVRFDPGTGSTTRIGALGRNCVGMSAGAGSLWVPACQGGPLTRIDPTTNSATRVPVVGIVQVSGQIPVAGDVAWITLDVDGGTFAAWNARTDEEIGRGTIGAAGSILAAGSEFAWAGNSPRGEIIQIDAESVDIVKTIDTSFPALYGATTADAVWIATGVDAARGEIVRIDPDTAEIVAAVPVSTMGPIAAADDGSVWVLGGPPARLSRIDPATNAIGETIDLGRRASSLTVDGDTIWVTRTEERELVRVDLAP